MTSKSGLVVTAHPAASEAGAQMLRDGGNAVDAAVVVAYVLSVVEPYSAGIGGGGFMVYRDAKTKKVSIIDYREVAPNKAHRDMYLENGKAVAKRSREGILAVAIPGMVPGLDVAQKRWGKKTLAESLDPAIRLAKDGFEILPVFVEESHDKLEMLQSNPEAARTFLKDGQPYAVGDRLVQPDLAKALIALKKEGVRLFTHGWVAQAMAAESKRLGGILTIEDLQKFTPRDREPVSGTYRGHTIYTMPPPSSGGTHILQMLTMLERDRTARARKSYWLDADDLHVLAESMRLAYADRAEHLGDPAFHKVPMSTLIAKDYLHARYATIDLGKVKRSSAVSAGKMPAPEPSETTNFTIIDAEGNVVVITQTVNASFGAGVVVPGTGILLNNEMDDFAAAPGAPNIYGLVGGEANSVQPGKIPLSSMSPTIVLKGDEVRLAIGSPGGSRIITTVLQCILHVLDYGLDIQSAISSPRIHHQWLPDKLYAEPGALTPELKAELTSRGHIVEQRKRTWSDATGIEVLPDGTRRGAADPRGDGTAVAQ